MNKDAQRTPAVPSVVVRMTDMHRAQGGPALRPSGEGAPLGIELRHLRYFVTLADAGSFTHAAEQIFIAQPTLSQQIRRLEEIVGTPLLRRRHEGLKLTAAGGVLVGTFAVLATLPVTFLTELGFAIAFGVLLDTIVVRSVLVTALNLDLGKNVWWPSRLAREPAPEREAEASEPAAVR